MERSYTAAGEVLAPNAKFSAQLYFLKGPQPGCLLIKLAVHLQAQGEALGGFLQSVSEEVGAVADAATLAKLLWDLVFSEKGTIAQVRKRIEGAPETAEEMARREPVNRPEFRPIALQILDAAAASGASRVELEIEEGHVVVLFDRAQRKDAAILAKAAYGRDKAIPVGGLRGSVQRVGEEVINGTLTTHPVKLFLGNLVGVPEMVGPLVVVWASNRDVPALSGQKEFAGRLMDREELDRLTFGERDAIPYSFEQSANPVLLVETASDWG
jgi:hypothetical protein